MVRAENFPARGCAFSSCRSGHARRCDRSEDRLPKRGLDPSRQHHERRADASRSQRRGNACAAKAAVRTCAGPQTGDRIDSVSAAGDKRGGTASAIA